MPWSRADDAAAAKQGDVRAVPHLKSLETSLTAPVARQLKRATCARAWESDSQAEQSNLERRSRSLC